MDERKYGRSRAASVSLCINFPDICMASDQSGELHALPNLNHSINDRWLATAGIDKTLIVWDWRSGDKTARWTLPTTFARIYLLDHYVVSVDIDGTITVFSILEGDTVGHCKISELSSPHSTKVETSRITNIGEGIRGQVNWIQGEGRFLTVTLQSCLGQLLSRQCGTRDQIIRLAWPEALSGTPVEVSPAKPTPIRARTTSIAARGSTNKLSSPVRQRTVSNIQRHLTPKRSLPSLRSTPNPSLPISPKVPSSSASRLIPSSLFPQQSSSRVDFSKPPKVVGVINAPDIERGTVHRPSGRIVGSTRFATRPGADRSVRVQATASDAQIYVHSGTSEDVMVPLGGAWQASATEVGRRTPDKNPMCLAMDREKLVVSV